MHEREQIVYTYKHQSMMIDSSKRFENEQAHQRHNHWSHHRDWCISDDSNHVCNPLLDGWSMTTQIIYILIVVLNPFCDAESKVFHSFNAAVHHALQLFDLSELSWPQFQDWLIENRPFTQVQIQQFHMEL